VIYCVVPEELAGELYDKLVAYYANDPGVEVIVDRRRGGGEAPEEDRRSRPASPRSDTLPPAATE
jgi:hypothetical protein